MRAVEVPRYGPPEVMRLVERSDPTPGPGQLRVAVRAAGINAADGKLRAGGERGVVRLTLPWVPGIDAAGVVDELGPGVEGFAVGDEVWVSPHQNTSGAYAEKVVVDASWVARKPTSLSFVEAASMPTAALTAWQALIEVGGLGAGQRALVLAAAGGVGSLAVQIAHHVGAEVYATCGASSAELVRSLGADVIIDYRSQVLAEALSDVDVALITIATQRAEVLRVMRRGGRAVSIVFDLPRFTEAYGPVIGTLRAGVGVAGFLVRGRRRGVKASNLVRRPDGQQLATLARMVDDGALRPVVDKVFALDDVVQAHRYFEGGHGPGKVVLHVSD